MAKEYNQINSQGIKRHIDNVKREIEKEKAKVETPWQVLDLDTVYTEQVIAQVKQRRQDTSGSLTKIEILHILLKELEEKALPASLEGEYRRMISNLQNDVNIQGKEIERLLRINAPAALIESAEKRLMDSKTELDQALEVRPL